jgi:hypothetical protein
MMSALISDVVIELLLWYSVPLLLHVLVALLSVRTYRWSWLFPCQALTRLFQPTAAVLLCLVCERTAGGFWALLRVEILQTVHPAAVLLAANKDVKSQRRES